MRSPVTRRRRLRPLIMLGYLAMILAACGRGSGPGAPPKKGVIRFSIDSPGAADPLSQSRRTILADMAVRTGLRVEPVFAVGDAPQAELLRRGAVDAGWFSNAAGLQAVRRGAGEVFARTLPVGTSEGDQALLVVNSERRLDLQRVLKCNRTLTINLGDGRSETESLAPTAYLFAPAGLDPRRCFRQVRSASPATALQAVADGHLDLAVVGAAWLQGRAASGRADSRRVRVLWASPPLPGDPIIWRQDLDPATREKLRQFFLTYGHGFSPAASRQRAVLAGLGVAGFQPADNNHLLPIREMEAAQGWFLARQGGDRNRIAAARKTLDNIRAQREALEARTRAPAAAQ